MRVYYLKVNKIASGYFFLMPTLIVKFDIIGYEKYNFTTFYNSLFDTYDHIFKRQFIWFLFWSRI